ncbi:MAG: reverse transcriptase domain-containing protein, partial [Pseudomonadota bacterium]
MPANNNTKTAISASGDKISLNEQVVCNLAFEDLTYAVPFFVGDIVPKAILGMDLMRVLPFSLTFARDCMFSLLPGLLSEFDDIFDKKLHDSCLKNYEPTEVIPIVAERPYRASVRQFSKADEKIIDEKIEELRLAGVIEPSVSPWRCSPVLVNKKDGSKRMTINYKPVNDQTIFDAFPLPIIDELISKLHGAKIFSKLDFSQFYHQIPLCESDKPKTSFSAGGQLWQYTRLPFGLRNAVPLCSRIMRNLFNGVRNCLVYLDDLLIFGENQSDHDNTLREVFSIIRKSGLGLNKKKCSFNLKEIDFLGFKIDDGKVRPTDERLSGLLSFTPPKDLKSLERFLGMATYFSKFIDHFSDVVNPLLMLKKDLLERGVRRKNPVIDFWSQDAEKSFQSVKSKLQDSILTLPSPDEKLILRTDASNDCIAAVVETVSGQPVSFLSRKLNKTELNYDIVEKEALAIFWGILRSKLFLLGREFKVYSDQKSLKYLFNCDKTTPKIIRWRLALQPFNFTVEHCSGKNNPVADCLSRMNAIEIESNIDFSSILNAQEKDVECQALVTCLKNGVRVKPQSVSRNLWAMRKTLKLKNNYIYNASDLLFVPYRCRLKILTLCHGLHRGISSTYECLRQNFFWPGDYKAVSTLVKDCRICSLCRPQFLQPPNTPIITKSPMEVLALDFVGPLPVSNGYKYLLTAIDMYSRYAFIEPVKDLSTVSLISACKNIFSICGFPNTILSDRGSQFCSNEFRSFLKNFKMRYITTCAYSPKSNGCCERLNGTVQRSIYTVNPRLSG